MKTTAVFAIVAALPIAFGATTVTPTTTVSVTQVTVTSSAVLSTPPATSSTAISSTPVPPSSTVTSDPYPTECASALGVNPWTGVASDDCLNLLTACAVAVQSTTYLWHKSACVAAATCNGPTNVHKVAHCINSQIAASRAATSDFSTNIWKDIVGDASVMTRQNYIDFYYGTLTAINTTAWPVNSSHVLVDQWYPINNWVQTGDTIPYKNFDDFLHYAPY